jgi:UDP-N-acetylmuramoyl-tripeptide--D-alanyl-D-alanine ligase
MNNLYSKYLKCTGVSTDTRNILKGSLFFALKGDSFDGNRFAAQALENGAQYAVVDDPTLPANPNFIPVSNALQSLQELAKHHRQQLKIPVIGITGTNGKTTTKELIYSVLSQKFNTLATKGNLNNHIGVPLTLLGITTETEVAIIEMGANHPGEIALLSSIADPNFGLITNIGKAHLEGFGGYEGVIKTKSELYHHLKQKNGIAFVNQDDQLLVNLSSNITCVYYGVGGEKIKLLQNASNPFVELTIDINGTRLKVNTQLIGQYNIPNILAAVCIGNYFKIEPAQLSNALENYSPGNMRSQFKNTQKNQLIVDAYNANPSSMEVALQNFATLEANNKALILGEMLELGNDSLTEHQNLIKKIAETQAKHVFLVGKAFQPIQLPKGFLHFETTDQLRQHFQKEPLLNRLILLKGSRGNKLEILLDVL